jgi:hypothetical protein
VPPLLFCDRRLGLLHSWDARGRLLGPGAQGAWRTSTKSRECPSLLFCECHMGLLHSGCMLALGAQGAWRAVPVSGPSMLGHMPGVALFAGPRWVSLLLGDQQRGTMGVVGWSVVQQ